MPGPALIGERPADNDLIPIVDVSAVDKTKFVEYQHIVTGLALAAHTHPKSEVDDAGMWGIAEIPTGSTPSTVCIGDDVRLSDARTPTAHATSHKSGGGDAIKLNEFANPTGSVEFSQQQSLQFRLENRTADPATPADGEIWLRTDL